MNKDPSSFYKKVSLYGKQGNVHELSEEEKKMKRRTFISLLLSMGILQTLYMNLATFFPKFAEVNYPWIHHI
jgi:hypothetical protein